MTSAADFDKLGVFYLGRPWDLATKQRRPGVVLYDSRDLLTHAVCVGMTGSGKTGLCLSLIEEAALDGIPAIVIDPKGDLANLLLTFPELRPEDFRPWVDEDEARRSGQSPDDYARQQAETWRAGLADWGIDGARIRRFRDSVDLAVYTPGSEAGIPVSILGSFAAPPPAIRADGELLRERVAGTVTSLLGLLGVDADPVKSREHILLATLIDAAWRDGRDLDLPALVQAIQTPGVTRIGALDVESFFPAQARFELAMALNNLLAAPAFAAWMTGETLDVARLLATPSGQPRIAIFSIAHLGDAERMFFVSLLLNQVLAWTRAQAGTSSLRAIVYMDEIFGFFPPVANPPSKLPLLTLLKQARAFGVGVVLATQNPVDLDYKGLSNAGTWLIGRLQTERDKARVLEGLEGAAAGAGRRFDRGRMEEVLAGLGKRTFLLSNVHEDAPVVFETRWAMSYLRGPLSRDQIRRLMAERAAAAAPTLVHAALESPATAAAGAASPPSGVGPVSSPVRAGGAPIAGAEPLRASGVPAPAVAAPTGSVPGRPLLPPDVPQRFVPVRGAAPAGAALVYQPMAFGAAAVRFVDAKRRIDSTTPLAVMTPITDEAVAVDWSRASEVPLAAADLESAPEDGARFAELPAAAARPRSYEAWRKDLAGWLFRTRTLALLGCPRLGAVSQPGETEGEFRTRLQHGAREQRDVAVEQLKKKYAPRRAAIEEKIRRADQAVERESEQVQQQGLQAAISIGTTLLGAMLGRKALNASTLGRATTAARGAGRVLKERQDVGRAQETVAALRQQLADLDEAFRAEALALADPAASEPLEPVSVRPTRQNVTVTLVALAWAPVWQGADGQCTVAWQ